MFKCSTLSQYFQVKPAFFSRLFHVLPAEARLSAQNLSFCGENRREGQAPPYGTKCSKTPLSAICRQRRSYIIRRFSFAIVVSLS